MISGQALVLLRYGWSAQLAVERTAVVADLFQLKSTQRLCGRPFLYNDDSSLVLSKCQV